MPKKMTPAAKKELKELRKELKKSNPNPELLMYWLHGSSNYSEHIDEKVKKG